MANINNRIFEFCSDITEVRTNYSKESCVQAIKNAISKISGADPTFKSTIVNMPVNQFYFDCRFVPVYKIYTSAKYSWSEDTVDTVKGNVVDLTMTTTTDYTQERNFSGYRYKGIDNVLELDKFVGGNDQRFYSLNLPSDLDYPLYNDTTNCYSQKEISDIAPSIADPAKWKEGRVILGWDCEVFFVPVAILSYKYNGKQYSVTFNLHNGRMTGFDYIISDEAIKLAKVACAEGKECFKVALPVSLALLIYGLICWFFIPGKIVWDIIFSIWGVCVVFFAVAEFLPNEKDLASKYGTNINEGRNGAAQMRGNLRSHIVFSALSAVVFTIIIII